VTSTAIAAYLLVSDTTGRWLVVEDPENPDVWRLPGRTVTESDASPAAAAAAAVGDQTGLHLTAGPLLAVRWISSVNTLALIFSSFVLDRGPDGREGRTWRMVSPQFAHSRLHPLIDQALTEMSMGGPIRYGEHATIPARVARSARGIRTAAQRTQAGSTIQSTFPCCYHKTSKLSPTDVAKLAADPDDSVRRQCFYCRTHYDVKLIGPASEPQALEWLVPG
jgi:hypothetical protein